MPTVFAIREQGAAQQVSTHVTRAVSELTSLPVANLKPRGGTTSAPPNLQFLDILVVVDRVMNLASSQTAKEANEAAEKAKTWSMVGCIIAVIVAIVVAIVVAVFSFGAGAPAAVAITTGVTAISREGALRSLSVTRALMGSCIAAAALAASAMVQFLREAHLARHPIAGRFGVAMSLIAQAAQSASSGDAAQANAAMGKIRQALLDIEKLTIEAGSLPGPCLGDPHAIYQCGRAVAPLVSQLSSIIKTMGILRDAGSTCSSRGPAKRRSDTRAAETVGGR